MYKSLIHAKHTKIKRW